MRTRGGRLHCGTASLVGWADAVFGDQSAEVRCRPGHVIGLTFHSPNGPRHIIHGVSKFTRMSIKSSLGGAVCAHGDMVDHMALIRDFFEPYVGLSLGVIGSGECENSSYFSNAKRAIAELYLARHFLSVQQATEQGELRNKYGLPVTGNPSDGLTEVRSDEAPPSLPPESGKFAPRHHSPPTCIQSKGTGGKW